MLRALWAVVFSAVAYFALCFLVGTLAGGRAGVKYPNNAVEIGARVGGRTVEENRPYLVCGTVVLGVVTASLVRFDKKRAAPCDAGAGPGPEGGIYKAPNLLRQLIKPALLLITLGLVAFFLYYLIYGYDNMKYTVGGAWGYLRSIPGVEVPGTPQVQPDQPLQDFVPKIRSTAPQVQRGRK